MEALFSRKWSLGDYLKFVTPSILSMISVALYMVVDALFIARFVGPLAMASMNIIMPFFSVSMGIGIMMSAGASAIIGIELGKGEKARANAFFSLTFAFLLALAAALVLVSLRVGPGNISSMLGASAQLLEYSTDYLSVFVFGIGMILIQIFFEYFMRLDGKPAWALYTTLGAGITNIIFDYIFIVHFDMGIQGGAFASVSGTVVAIAIGLFYFNSKNRVLRFTMPSFELRFLSSAMLNGSSEMVSQISAGVKTLAFNYVIIQYAGEYGIAAMAIFLNMYFLLSSFHMGLAMGVAPVLSFNYGQRNFAKMRELMKTSLLVTMAASLASYMIAIWFGGNIIDLFAKGNSKVIRIAENGLAIFAVTFLMEGLCIFISGFFTSVGNGKLSAVVSFLKTFVFTLGFVFLLPPLMGMDGVWLSVPLSEGAALLISIYFVMRTAHRYLNSDDSEEQTASLSLERQAACPE